MDCDGRCNFCGALCLNNIRLRQVHDTRPNRRLHELPAVQCRISGRRCSFRCCTPARPTQWFRGRGDSDLSSVGRKDSCGCCASRSACHAAARAYPRWPVSGSRRSAVPTEQCGEGCFRDDARRSTHTSSLGATARSERACLCTGYENLCGLRSYRGLLVFGSDRVFLITVPPIEVKVA